MKHATTQLAMDWHSWLSRTGLEPSLIQEYGLTFTRNELGGEDMPHFNHEFLQSMGISIAKHRLEILKLARKEVGGSPRNLSRLVLAINSTKRLFTKKVGKWVFHKDTTHLPLLELSPYQAQWNGELRKHKVTSKSPTRSGPLEFREQKQYIVPNRGLSVSGPLDGKMQEKLLLANWSPTISRPKDGRTKGSLVIANRGPSLSGPLDGAGSKLKKPCDNVKVDDEVQSLWSLMFQDMKPT